MFPLKYIINTRQGVSIECCYITSSTTTSLCTSLSNDEDNFDKVQQKYSNWWYSINQLFAFVMTSRSKLSCCMTD